jgi:hypothetical protein
MFRVMLDVRRLEIFSDSFSESMNQETLGL